jgi:hypothetical protein
MPDPLDPRFVVFRDGWKQWIEDKPQYLTLRWNPAGPGGWFAYSMDTYDYIDFGRTGPPSPLTREFDEMVPVYKWSISFTEKAGVFAAIDATYAQVKAQHPSAVWNPYDGSWREIRAKAGGPPPPRPPSTNPPVNPELARRLAELRALYDAHPPQITDEQLKERTIELLREYG